MNFRAYALKIPGIGAGPKYTLVDQLATKRKSKNSQVFDSALANYYHRRSLVDAGRTDEGSLATSHLHSFSVPGTNGT